MNLYLSRLDCQTKYTKEERIFKEVSDTDLSDKKITKVFKLYFKISITCEDNKRIKAFRVNHIIPGRRSQQE
jgi:hypothetical protein